MILYARNEMKINQSYETEGLAKWTIFSFNRVNQRRKKIKLIYLYLTYATVVEYKSKLFYPSQDVFHQSSKICLNCWSSSLNFKLHSDGVALFSVNLSRECQETINEWVICVDEIVTRCSPVRLSRSRSSTYILLKGGNFIYPLMLRGKFVSFLRGGKSVRGFRGRFSTTWISRCSSSKVSFNEPC